MLWETEINRLHGAWPERTVRPLACQAPKHDASQGFSLLQMDNKLS